MWVPESLERPQISKCLLYVKVTCVGEDPPDILELNYFGDMGKGDVVEAVAWLILSHGKAPGHSCCSLSESTMSAFQQDRTGAGRKRGQPWHAACLPVTVHVCLFGWDGFCGSLYHFHSHPAKAFLKLLCFLILRVCSALVLKGTLWI